VAIIIIIISYCAVVVHWCMVSRRPAIVIVRPRALSWALAGRQQKARQIPYLHSIVIIHHR
jgi:hypothetical protein